MRRKLLLALLVSALAPVPPTHATEYIVSNRESGYILTINLAMTVASDGDTITVLPSDYREILTVTKRLLIRSRDGSSTTAIRSTREESNVVTILNENVELRGFTLRDGAIGLDISTHVTNVTLSDIAFGNTAYCARIPPMLVESIVPLLTFADGDPPIIISGGRVTESTTWPQTNPPLPYEILPQHFVLVAGDSWPELTIESGVELTIQDSGSIRVESRGALIADGVVFDLDSSPWHWGGGKIEWTYDYDGTRSRLTGSSFSGGGITVRGEAIRIENCSFTDTRVSAVADGITGLFGGGNDLHGGYVHVLQSNLTSSATWPVPPNGRYFLDGAVTVGGDAFPVLEIHPDAILEFEPIPESRLVIAAGGGLRAENVEFQYPLVEFGSACQADQCVITGCRFTRSKFQVYGEPMVRVVGAPVTITDSDFESDAPVGIELVSADITLTGCTFRGLTTALDINGASQTQGISGNIIETANGFPIHTVIGCVEDVVNNNTIVPRADKQYSGIVFNTSHVDQDATLPPLPPGFAYCVEAGDTLVVAGPGAPTLTVQPGVVMKLHGSLIHVGAGGALVADGAIFTSYGDATVVGRTYPDAPAPAPGDWLGFEFAPDCNAAACGVHDSEIRYADHGVRIMGAPISVERCLIKRTALTGVTTIDADPSIRNTRFTDGRGVGLAVLRGNPLVDSCEFEDFLGAGMSIVDAGPIVTACTFVDNARAFDLLGASAATGIQDNVIAGPRVAIGSCMLRAPASCLAELITNNTIAPRADMRYGGIGIVPTPVTADAVLPALPANLVYAVGRHDTLTVGGPGNPVLSIEAGAIIKLDRAAIHVGPGGALDAVGAVFTSYRDDTYGGDTDGFGPSVGKAGEWRGLVFSAESRAEVSRLQDCTLRYGGMDQPMIDVLASFSILNCVVAHSAGAGVRVVGAQPTVSACTIRNTTCGLDLGSAAAVEGITGNSITEPNDHPSSYLAIAKAAHVVEVVANNVVIGRADGRYGRIGISPGILQEDASWPALPPGQAYYFANGSQITVAGRDSPILTLEPDAVLKFEPGARIHIGEGGTLLADGVVFTSYRDDTVAGDSDGDAESDPAASDWVSVVFLSGSTGNLTECGFRYGGAGGVGAVHCAATSTVRVGFSNFVHNGIGVSARANARPTLFACCFTGNRSFGVQAEPPTDFGGSLHARDCWWGDASGPGGVGPGAGDAVSDHVLFEPWATEARCGAAPTPVVEDRPPPAFRLLAPCPNPFNPATIVSFDLPQPAVVDLEIFDVAGRLVRVIKSGKLYGSGRHSCTWDGTDEAGRDVAAGVYLCRIAAGGFTATQRMTLVK